MSEQDINPEDLNISAWSEKTATSSWDYEIPKGIKIIHKPTGIEVTHDKERSQHKNRAVAMDKLKLMLTNEKEHDYSLKVKVESIYGGKFNLLTSHNGNSWSGGTPLTLSELHQVRDELNDFLINKANE